MSVTLREWHREKKDDIHALLRFEHEELAGTDSYWGDQLLVLIDKYPSTVLVIDAEDPTEIAGFVFYWTLGVTKHVAKLVVAAKHRRKGYARHLMQAVLQNDSQDSVTLMVETSNAPALALYDSLGFSHECKLPGYYGTGRDALKLRCIQSGRK